MRILLTNDDGWDAPGIRALHNALAAVHEVVVVAPRVQQSGVGHAFTFHAPLTCAPMQVESGMSGHVVNGTPADCVKFAVGHLFKEKPDAVVAGLNQGENSGISGFYSGTVAAAREGAFWHVPSVAFSLSDKGWAWVSDWAERAVALFDAILRPDRGGMHDAPDRIFYNVNFPGCDPLLCRGVRATRQSMAFFDDRYRREAGGGDPCEDRYWLYGEKREVEESDEFDSRALLSGYVSVTPSHFDTTAVRTRECLVKMEQSMFETISPHRS